MSDAHLRELERRWRPGAAGAFLLSARAELLAAQPDPLTLWEPRGRPRQPAREQARGPGHGPRGRSTPARGQREFMALRRPSTGPAATRIPDARRPICEHRPA